MLREVRLDAKDKIFKINEFLDCGAALTRPRRYPFECDNPMDMQFGADGDFYLLTYGDGFFNANPDAGMYRSSTSRASARRRPTLNATPTNGHRAAHRPLLQRRLARPGPG